MGWLPEKLPTSSDEAKSLIFVSVISAIAALSRLMYGKDAIHWRYLVGSIAVAMATSVFVYGLASSYFGNIGGQMSAAIGAAVGLFTDDVLKRARDYVAKKKLPGESE